MRCELKRRPIEDYRAAGTKGYQDKFDLYDSSGKLIAEDVKVPGAYQPSR